MKRTAWWNYVDNGFDNGDFTLTNFLFVLMAEGVLAGGAVEQAAADIAREAVANPEKFRKTVARLLRWGLLRWELDAQKTSPLYRSQSYDRESSMKRWV